jgi:hypothetical protein
MKTKRNIIKGKLPKRTSTQKEESLRNKETTLQKQAEKD